MLDWRNQAEAALQESAPDSGRTNSAHTRQILVVDDEPMIQRLIGRVFSREGHVVDSAGDGETAWLMLQKKHYDCIIMDWKMPGLTGRELYQLIEGHDLKMANRCLFMSGYAANSEIEELVTHKRNLILLKPFPIERLQKLVGTLLEANVARL